MEPWGVEVDGRDAVVTADLVLGDGPTDVKAELLASWFSAESCVHAITG